MYQPLAAAVIAAMAAALRAGADARAGCRRRWCCARRATARDEDVALLRWLKARYAPLLDRCLRHPRLVALVTLLRRRCRRSALGAAGRQRLHAAARRRRVPAADGAAAEASLDEVDRLNHRVEDVLREVPEVEDVVRRTGRAERTEDPMPHTLSDVLVVLKTRPDARSRRRSRTTCASGSRTCPASPCCSRRRSACASTKGLGGTPADLSVRVFGPDLDELARLAEQAERIMARRRRASTDLRAEALTGLPQLQIAVDREATARVGLAPGDVIRAVRVGLVGEEGAAGLDRAAALRPGGAAARRPPRQPRRDPDAADRRPRRHARSRSASWRRSRRRSARPRSGARPAGGASPSRRRSPAAISAAPPARCAQRLAARAEAAEPATSSTSAAGSRARRARRAR